MAASPGMETLLSSKIAFAVILRPVDARVGFVVGAQSGTFEGNAGEESSGRE